MTNEQWVVPLQSHIMLGKAAAFLLSCDLHAGGHHFTIKGDMGTIQVSQSGLDCLKRGFGYND